MSSLVKKSRSIWPLGIAACVVSLILLAKALSPVSPASSELQEAPTFQLAIRDLPVWSPPAAASELSKTTPVPAPHPPSTSDRESAEPGEEVPGQGTPLTWDEEMRGVLADRWTLRKHRGLAVGRLLDLFERHPDGMHSVLPWLSDEDLGDVEIEARLYAVSAVGDAGAHDLLDALARDDSFREIVRIAACRALPECRVVDDRTLDTARDLLDTQDDLAASALMLMGSLAARSELGVSGRADARLASLGSWAQSRDMLPEWLDALEASGTSEAERILERYDDETYPGRLVMPQLREIVGVE